MGVERLHGELDLGRLVVEVGLGALAPYDVDRATQAAAQSVDVVGEDTPVGVHEQGGAEKTSAADRPSKVSHGNQLISAIWLGHSGTAPRAGFA